MRHWLVRRSFLTHRLGRITTTGVLLAAMLSSTVRAQNVPVASATPDHPVKVPTRVTIDVDGAPLLSVVSLVARQAGLRPAYNESILPPGARVTLHVRDLAVEDAFQQILKGTGLVAQIRPAGTVVIAPSSNQDVHAGGITVTVSDATTKRPVAGVAVTLDESKHPVTTREDGVAVLAGVSAGVHKIVARRLGYRLSSLPVTVRDDATETVSIALVPAAMTLTDVVTTATGDRKRYEVGNAVGTIKADSIVPTTLIRNVSDLLQARVPGVIVSNTDGAVGAPSKIRIRGVNSLTLNNDPIVILDGIRLNAQTTVAQNQTNVGASTLLYPMDGNGNRSTNGRLAPSRLDDIDPNTIESIDVLRGPSASSLYGTDAANGVIVIKTKKGQAGSWRFTFLGDQGWSTVPGRFDDLWWGFGKVNGVTVPNCTLAIGGIAQVARGTCVQDSVRNFNYENDPQMRTIGTGTTQSLAINASGGTQSVQQFLSLRSSNQVGMAKMSEVQARIIERLWATPAPSWMKRPNTQQDIDGSSRSTFQLSPTLDMSLTATGLYRNLLSGGSGIIIPNRIGQGVTPSDTLGLMPSDGQRTKITALAKRGMLSSTGNYAPWHWLQINGALGGDYTLQSDESNLRAQDCSYVLQQVYSGSDAACASGHDRRQGETFVKTANVTARNAFTPTPWLMLQTSLGEQYSRTTFSTLEVGSTNGCSLAFGTTLLSPPPVCPYPNAELYNVNEYRDEQATAGWYLEEEVQLLGMYTTFGFRRDVSSGFGGQVNKRPPFYPKFNLSYLLSDKSFFPKQDVVSSLRLRLAYGHSGNTTSQTAVLNQYTLQQEAFGTATTPSAAVYVLQLGNPNLKPERGTEWEGGFDASFLANERIRTEFTLYKKFTRDAINNLTLPPSFGAQQLYEYVNLGNVENRGLELSITARLLDARMINWDLTVNYTRNTNRLVHKAPTLQVGGGYNTENHEGYPLFGYWGSPIVSYADLNGDGILSQREITFGSPVFMGAPYPKSEVTYVTGMGLFNDAVRVSANFDQVNGLVTPHSTGGVSLTRGGVDRSASLAEQAEYIQAVINGDYFRQSSTMRFNELSVSYNVPRMLALRLLHVQSLAVTFAGRNLALWTNYIGRDPNGDTSGVGNESTYNDFNGTPQPRNFTLRFNLGL